MIERGVKARVLRHADAQFLQWGVVQHWLVASETVPWHQNRRQRWNIIFVTWIFFEKSKIPFSFFSGLYYLASVFSGSDMDSRRLRRAFARTRTRSARLPVARDATANPATATIGNKSRVAALCLWHLGLRCRLRHRDSTCIKTNKSIKTFYIFLFSPSKYIPARFDNNFL